MSRMTRRNRPLLGDTRGVALPVALMALVVISLLVTAALLTSSTEMGLSSAHSEGVRSLYGADAALEGFVYDRAVLAQTGDTKALATGAYTKMIGSESFNIAVTELAETRTEDATNGSASQVFSITAERSTGRGRSVGAFIATGRSWTLINTQIDEGVATGGGIRNSGNSEISAFSDICANEGGSGVAVRFTNDVTDAEKAQLDITRIEGDTATLTDVSSEQMISYALGGATREDVFAKATIKFGYDGAPDYADSNKPTSFNPSDIGSSYHWGCPARVIACEAAEDSLKVPVIAIDAKGKTLDFQGEHGQGILYIYNGNVKITGKFVFFGVVIIDGGYFEVAGTGTDGTKIEGSLLSTGGVKDSRISGNAVVNYNSCAVESSESAFNQNAESGAAQVLNGGTYGWFERIR